MTTLNSPLIHRAATPTTPVPAVTGLLGHISKETVARVFGISGLALHDTKRGRAQVARARQIAMYLLHVGGGVSLTDVGRVYNRDRTTVSHACGLVEDLRDDPRIDLMLDFLEQAVVCRAGLGHSSPDQRSVRRGRARGRSHGC